MMKKSMTDNKAMKSEIKINLFQKFSEIAKFKKLITNSI